MVQVFGFYKIIIEWSKDSKKRFSLKNNELVRHKNNSIAPVNYGCVLGKINPADNSEADAIILGDALEVGTIISAKPIGIIKLKDGDHKVIFGEKISKKDIKILLNWFEEKREAKIKDEKSAIKWLESLEKS